MPPSLSELTPYYILLGLTYLGLKATSYTCRITLFCEKIYTVIHVNYCKKNWKKYLNIFE